MGEVFTPGDGLGVGGNRDGSECDSEAVASESETLNPETKGVILGAAPPGWDMSVVEIQKAFGCGYAKVKSAVDRGLVTAYRSVPRANFKLNMDEFSRIPGWQVSEENQPDEEDVATDAADAYNFGGVFSVTEMSLIDFFLDGEDGDVTVCHKLARGGAVLENLRTKQAYLIESTYDKSAMLRQ